MIPREGFVLSRRRFERPDPSRPARQIASAMSDATLPEPRAAALESAASAMKSTASKAGRGGPADVRSCDPAAGMETSPASKGRRCWGADVDPCGSAKSMPTAPHKTWRHWPADMGDSGGVELMKAAGKAAVESAASGARGNGGVCAQAGGWGNAASAQAPRRGA
jgi:hypothetical protein